MKKICSWNLLVIIALLMANCVFTSCSDSEDEEDIITALKANKWVSQEASSGSASDEHAWFDIETTTLYFTSDNTGVRYWQRKDYDTELGDSKEKEYTMFTYTVSGKTITFDYEETGEYHSLKFNNNALFETSGSIAFVPAAMTANDYEIIRSVTPKSIVQGSITYVYSPLKKELTVSGSGAIPNYSTSNQPWRGFFSSNVTPSFSKITIQEGITSIGDNAFFHTWASEIELPSTLRKIGASAFEKASIKEIMIPLYVEEIGEFAFADCSSLADVIFNNNNINSASLKTIGNYAFHGCNISKGIYLPYQLESIGTLAFSGSFSSISFEKNIKTLGNRPFSTTASSGIIYINRSTPPTTTESSITGKDSGWFLRVPVGAKNNYSSVKPWKSFKSITESDTLDGGGSNDDGGGDDDDDDGGGDDDDDDNYNPSGTFGGHGYVDLGLPSGTLWATCNIGASKPEEYGDYFAWGETTTKSDYDWDTYKYCNGSMSTLTKYCTQSGYGYNSFTDGKKELDPEDDAATANWGSGWRMPSYEQCEELRDKSYTTTEWTTQGGVNGRRITSKSNGNSIFLPAAGRRDGTGLNDVGSYGRYWSRSLYTDKSLNGRSLYFYSSDISTYRSYRYSGRSVRPVRVLE